MRRTVRFALGWLAAVVAAVGVSWWTIRDAVDPGWLSGSGPAGSGASVAAPAVVGQPTSRGADAATPSPTPSTTGSPTASATGRPSASAPPGPVASTSTAAAVTASRPSASTVSAGSPSGAVSSYVVTGGRVLLRLTANRADLVSALPDQGFSVQSWEADGWLRVDFSQGGTTRSSVFATWNGTPPTVTTARY